MLAAAVATSALLLGAAPAQAEADLYITGDGVAQRSCAKTTCKNLRTTYKNYGLWAECYVTGDAVHNNKIWYKGWTYQWEVWVEGYVAGYYVSGSDPYPGVAHC